MAVPIRQITEEDMAQGEARRQAAFDAADKEGGLSNFDIQDLVGILGSVGSPTAGLASYTGGRLADRWSAGGPEVMAEEILGPPEAQLMGMVNPIGMATGPARGLLGLAEKHLGSLFSKPKPTRKPVVSLGGGGVNPERQALLERIDAGRKQDALKAMERQAESAKPSIFATDRPASPKALSNFSASTPPPHPTPAQLKQARIHELQQQVANMGKHNPGDLTPAQADAMMWPPAKKPVLRGPEPPHRAIDFEHPVLGELGPQ